MSEPTEAIAHLCPLGFHYFRIPRERWELMLIRLRQMGADAISTIVPWSWHEPRDGLLDLYGTSHPMRDVPDFLETCDAMGFQVLINASPCAGAGLLGGGVPGWLLQEHPEIRALDPNSQARYDPVCGGYLPSAEHPTYLEHVERWYQALTDVMANWQTPNGPLAALRLDPLGGATGSEHQTQDIPAHWDYNPHVVEVQWPVWLRQQYDGLDALNTAWKTNYHSFSEAEFPRQLAAAAPSSRLDDAVHFVAYAAVHAAETYARLLREKGWVVPIATEPGMLAARVEYPKGTELSHAAQVDPQPPSVGAGIRWALDAPLRADGYPQRHFWEVKSNLLGAEEGIKLIEGGTLVTGSDSRRVRLPRPAGDYRIYRLLLDGQLLDAASRRRGDTLYLDYPAADAAGETDMYIILHDRSAPLSDYLQNYLGSLLSGKAHTLRQAESMCQALADVFSGIRAPDVTGRGWPAHEDLQVAEQGLAEALQAARRAAASIGRLERLANEVRGEIPPYAPALPELTAFSPEELERLFQVRDACKQVIPVLREAAESIAELWKMGSSGRRELTPAAYQASLDETRAAAGAAETTLASALARLRADLAAGVLSGLAWPLQDWLTRVLQGLIV